MRPFLASAFCLLLLASPLNVSAKNRADDLYDSMKAAIKTLRVPTEPMESTDLTYRSLPLSGIRSFSFPVSWGTRPALQKTIEQYRLSKAMNDLLAKTMLFKPEPQRDGTISYGMPLNQFFSRVYMPIVIQTAETPELRTVVLQKPVASDLTTPVEAQGFIQFCSFRPTKKINPKTEIATVSSVEDLKKLIESTLTVQSGERTGSDVFVPNIFTYALTDTQFLRKPAVKLSMNFSTNIYNLTMDRAQYEGIYTLKDGMVICAEVMAVESQFSSYRTVFDAVMTSIIAKDNPASGTSSSSVSSTSSKDASRSQSRQCKRTKKC